MTPEGLRLLTPRAKSDQGGGSGAELGIPRGMKVKTCPVRAVEAWLQASSCRYGPVFRKIDRWGNLETSALHPYALPRILARRLTFLAAPPAPSQALVVQ
ncbi:hypothetical protein CKO45_18755 [Paracraurococcus ruber]|uniref:Uncharacterized protein n=3 Tax=Paracraurococcus ruber TaxID=77675 RepID=A0ABS1D2E7_9PROT|nr:hypothetical protein [Paracraurococcus ruber]